MAKLKSAVIGITPTDNTQTKATASTPNNNLPEKPQKLANKTKMAIKMVQAGIDPTEALKTVNLKDNITVQAVNRLKQKVLKYSLTEPSLTRSAQSQIKRILKCRAREEAHTKVTKDGQVVDYIDNVYPTDSNILAAAQMVYDRYEPVKAEDSGPRQQINFIDLTYYGSGLPVDNSKIIPVDNSNTEDNQ